jgi:DNA-directed RNA polymerase specialized sigma24 family protein
VEQKELRGCVRRALRAMPKEWQQALVLRYELDISGPELARLSEGPRRKWSI